MIQITNLKRLILFLLVIAVITIGGLYKLMWGSTAMLRSGTIEITQGQSANNIWDELVKEKFTNRTLPWKRYGKKLNASETIQAGTYYIEQGEKIPDIIKRFITGDVTPDELAITYPEGFTLQQIAKRTEAKNIGTEKEFTNTAIPEAFANDFPFLKNIPKDRSLEGYLFPDTYRVFADDQPVDIITRMLANFDKKFTQELRNQAKENNRTMDEIVIMASIIEREVIYDKDMALVSDVLWKRFDEEIGLAADATTRYALDKWDEALTYQDLQTDSPYNTRKYKGLPPGPISNPGLRAIIAALQPQESNYYYYLSTPEGETIFSKTNDEHNMNKAKYLK